MAYDIPLDQLGSKKTDLATIKKTVVDAYQNDPNKGLNPPRFAANVDRPSGGMIPTAKSASPKVPLGTYGSPESVNPRGRVGQIMNDGYIAGMPRNTEMRTAPKPTVMDSVRQFPTKVGQIVDSVRDKFKVQSVPMSAATTTEGPITKPAVAPAPAVKQKPVVKKAMVKKTAAPTPEETFDAVPDEEGLREKTPTLEEMTGPSHGYGSIGDDDLSFDKDIALQAGNGTYGISPDRKRMDLYYPGDTAAKIDAKENARMAEVGQREAAFQKAQMVPKDMSPGSHGAWELEQSRKGPDLSKMSMSDLVSWKLGQKRALNESNIGMHDAAARNSDVQGMVSQAKLPGDIQHTASQTRQANATADESRAMLPGKIRNQDISGAHTLASTGNVQADTALKAFQNSPQYQKLTLAEKQAHIDHLGRQNGLSDLTMEKLKLDIANYQTKEELAAAQLSTARENRRVAIASNPNMPISEIPERVEAISHDPRNEELITVSPEVPAHKEGGFLGIGATKVPKKEAVREWRPKAAAVPKTGQRVTATGPNGEKITYNTATRKWEK